VSGPGHLILPAFSGQAAGCVLGRHPLIGPAVRAADLDTVYACLGRHLLRMPMEAAISSARFLNEDSQRKKTPELKGSTKGGSDERLKG